MKPYLSLLFCLISMAARAQIIAPDTVCLYDTVSVSTTYNAVTYTWMDGTVTIAPAIGTPIIQGTFASTTPCEVLNDDGHWYMIASCVSTVPPYNIINVYALSYSNQCYTVKDTITVHHRNCSLWFPSAFTPNGDSKNDVAHVLGDLTYVSKYRLTIYNRWGRLVYSTNDMYSGWDGSYKGTAQDVGTYNYLIRYTYKGHEQKLDGAITLVR
jgi:gliding motility-associated-like protein